MADSQIQEALERGELIIENFEEHCLQATSYDVRVGSKTPPVNEYLLEGRLPRVDKDYFRELETESLTELGVDLRRLAVNVDQLTQSVEALSRGLRGTNRIMWPMVLSVAVAVLRLAFGVVGKVLF